jgi:hypothetical protein
MLKDDEKNKDPKVYKIRFSHERFDDMLHYYIKWENG